MFWLLLLHIARGAHGVLTKNKNFHKIFYSRPYNNLPPKTSCGRAPILARIVHIRAYIRRDDFFRLYVGSSRFIVSSSGLVLLLFTELRATNLALLQLNTAGRVETYGIRLLGWPRQRSRVKSEIPRAYVLYFDVGS